MRIFGIIAAFLIAFSVTAGQTAERWDELVLDETTPLQAIEIFGKTRLDRPSSLHVYDIQALLSADTAKLNFQALEWENVKGYKDVMLTFSSDDKLRMVFATPESQGTKSLENLCGGNWKPASRNLLKDFRSEIAAPSKSVLSAPITKSGYQVFALSPRAFCVADIINEPKPSETLLPAMTGFPGKVGIITMVSRAVESKPKPKAAGKKLPRKR
jgi:hypothetical protein